MTWEIGESGFRMGLSPQVPNALACAVPGATHALLAPHGLETTDVHWWAVHPGGKRIIDAAQECLALDSDAVAVSRTVLDAYGNCSSAGVIQVMNALQDTTPLPVGQYGVAIAFGPGLTVYSALLRGA
ncbi:3-oxoacyl-[acyl-carrier-protein] synthase III C-terminal domain-containing protein [Nocardia tengchongensis]